MKFPRSFVLLMVAPLAIVPLTGGCMFVHAPDPLPIPTEVPTPKPPYFDPASGLTRGTALNKPSDAALPDAFQIASATTGDLVAIQSIDTMPAGKPPKPTKFIGPPDTVKLAGITAPTTEPGLTGSINAVMGFASDQTHTHAQDLDVDSDPKYPLDLDGRRVVQIYFKGRKGPYEGQLMSLNRMLVRSGWAVVDLYSPTSFDTSQWFLDEAYARRHKLGFWQLGVAIQQRVPVITSRGTGAKSKVTIQVAPPGTPGAKTKTVSQATKTITTTAASTPASPASPAVATTPPPAKP